MKRSYEATPWNWNITGEVATNRGRAGEDLFYVFYSFAHFCGVSISKS